MKTEYTIDSFQPKLYAKPTETTGRFYTGKLEINTSSILTALIQTAGRFCERFASDLFIDWQSVMKQAQEIEPGETVSRLLGFREDGVDGNTYILHNYNQYGGSMSSHYYRKLYRLDMHREQDDLHMRLTEVYAY